MDQDYKTSLLLRIRQETGLFNFSRQCLPVCLASLPLIRKDYPSARVVIGTTYENGNATACPEDLRLYIEGAPKDFDPPFHAWIEVGNGDILDLTWGSTHSGKHNELDSAILDLEHAEKYQIRYEAVITDEKEVITFNQRIMHPDTPGFNYKVPFHKRKLQDPAPLADTNLDSESGWLRKLGGFIRKFSRNHKK